MLISTRYWLPLVGIFFLSEAAQAQLIPVRRPDPTTDAPPPIPANSPEEHLRAGMPGEISPLAHFSDTGRYVGYYIGGGCFHWRKGRSPTVEEGTWGWDYLGGCFRRRVVLDWWQSSRYQGGTGQYQSDGPHVLPALRETRAQDGEPHP